MNNIIISQLISIFGINTDWSSITNSIGRLFFGGSYIDAYGIMQNTTGIFPGNPMQASLIAGLIILMFFLLLTAIFGMGMLIGSCIILPALFAVFQYIPGLYILIAIFSGILFGLAIHKFIKR